MECFINHLSHIWGHNASLFFSKFEIGHYPILGLDAVAQCVSHFCSMSKHLTVRLDQRAVRAVTEVSGLNGGNISRAINQLIRAGREALVERASYKRWRAARDTVRSEMAYDAAAAKRAKRMREGG